MRRKSMLKRGKINSADKKRTIVRDFFIAETSHLIYFEQGIRITKEERIFRKFSKMCEKKNKSRGR